jgi:hypothetical protein
MLGVKSGLAIELKHPFQHGATPCWSQPGEPTFGFTYKGMSFSPHFTFINIQIDVSKRVHPLGYLFTYLLDSNILGLPTL